MHELKAIIFDMDGTLADTEDIHRRAFNQAFVEFGFDWQWSFDDYKRLLSISGGRERIRSFLIERKIESPVHQDLWHFAKSIHQRKSDIYRKMLVDGPIQLRQGVERLIHDALARNITLAIATSSSAKNVEALLLTALGEDALSFFPVVISSDKIDDKKPSPAAYRMALSELGIKAEQCIAIEDTYNGNRAALDAHIKTVVTTHPYTVDDDFSGASLVIEELGEPDQPFTLISGNAYKKTYVDTGLLERICADDASSGPDADWSANNAAITGT